MIERVLQIATNPGDLVLDSFAGSGTTGHAVLKMNSAAKEADARRFILVEMEAKIATDITRERVKRVAGGYTNAKGAQAEGLGGGFRYVTLGDALFDETGQIRNTVRFAELARHVYFTETGEPLPKERVSAKTPLLGIHRGKAIYLLYNGILSDRSIGGGNALCRETLQVIEEINAGHEWRRPLPPRNEDIPTLTRAEKARNSGIIDVVDGNVVTRELPEVADRLRLIEVRENWDVVRLVSWLDRNIPHDDLDAGVARAWFDAVIQRMREGVPLGRLVRERFDLRRSLEAVIATLRRDARRQEYQMALFGDHHIVKVRVGGGYNFVYDPNAYPARTICPRSGDFVRHYYEKVGELETETGKGKAKEEFLCAQFIDEQPEIEWWVRNLDRQPAHSFWLQTSTDRFYPDFVAKLTNGRILAVEYKGEDRSTNRDSEEKERLGKLWEERSGGQCLFEMVKGQGELSKIRDAIRKAFGG